MRRSTNTPAQGFRPSSWWTKTAKWFSIRMPARITAAPKPSWPTSSSCSPARLPRKSRKRADGSRLEQTHGRDRDPAAETDIDITARLAMAKLILAGKIKVALFFVPVVEGKGIGIELAPDDFRVPGIGRQVRQIDIVKQTGLDRFRQDVGEDRSGPSRGAGPVEFDFGFAIVRDGDPGPAMQDRLAHRGDRAGIVNVRAEIRAVVDPAQDPFCVRDQFE